MLIISTKVVFGLINNRNNRFSDSEKIDIFFSLFPVNQATFC